MLVSKEVPALTVAEQIGQWTVETCLICAVPYYAHNEDTQLPNLISAKLISDPNTILGLRKHEDYSPVFRIVIKPRSDVAKKLERESGLWIRFNFFLLFHWFILVQTALSGLQHHLGHVIKKQAEKTDENIRIFTDQQYEKLTAFQNRAMLDHAILVA